LILGRQFGSNDDKEKGEWLKDTDLEKYGFLELVRDETFSGVTFQLKNSARMRRMFF